MTIISELNILYVIARGREKKPDKWHHNKAAIKESCICSRGAAHFPVEVNSTCPAADSEHKVGMIQSRGPGVLMEGVPDGDRINVFVLVIPLEVE